jgi:biotin carboxyl carrier protein
MRSYKISVNGQSYDVTVEEVGAAAPALRATAQPVSAAVAAPAKAAAPASPSASTPAAGASGTTQVKAPMPGTLLAFKAAAGQAVKRGEVLLILEAMKMENEITAPIDGVVTVLRVAEGASVSTGDVLLELA